jgi:hypothetical protein
MREMELAGCGQRHGNALAAETIVAGCGCREGGAQ